MEWQAILALVFLVIAIALGFAKGMNTGVVSMGLALIACMICGLSDSQLQSGFPVNMFLILFGTMFLFGIAQKTETMALLARKVIALVGNASWLLPWAIFLLTFAVSALGAGPAPSIAIVALPALSLAVELGVSPFLFGLMCSIGGCGGAASPFSTAGIVAQALIEDFGWSALQPAYFINAFIGHFIVALAAYLVLRGWRIKPEKKIDRKDIPGFNRNQVLTLIGIGAFIALVILLGRNVGLTALIVGLVLVML